MHFEVFMSNDSMIKNQDAMDEAPTLVIKLFASMSCAKSLLIIGTRTFLLKQAFKLKEEASPLLSKACRVVGMHGLE